MWKGSSGNLAPRDRLCGDTCHVMSGGNGFGHRAAATEWSGDGSAGSLLSSFRGLKIRNHLLYFCLTQHRAIFRSNEAVIFGVELRRLIAPGIEAENRRGSGL
jgi:hypothetical protein